MLLNQTLIDNLQNALESFENVFVTFHTKRGTKRVMHCSRKDMAPPNTIALNHDSIIAVYDYQNSAWRSFRKDSVISFEVKV